MTNLQFLRVKQILPKLGISKTALYDRITNGLFPVGIQISKQSVAWLNSEVDTIIMAIVNGKSNDEIKTVVRDIMQARGDI